MDSMDSDSEPESSTSKLEGWTKKQKYLLLEALKCYGSTDLESLTECVGKSDEEILAALSYYKRRAQKHIPPSTKRQAPCYDAKQYAVPLANWAKLATESTNHCDLQNESQNIATALRLIAEFEDLPKPSDTNNINFKDIYFLIANAVEGKSFDATKNLISIIEKLIIETALFSKSFIDRPDIISALSHINDIRMAPGDLAQTLEESTLQRLITQKVYNPFNIPKQYLKQEDDTE